MIAGIGTRPGDDQLRLVLAGQPRDRVEVDPVRVRRDAVADRLEVLAAKVELHAVRQVPAVGEVHAEDRVARLQGGEEDGHVRLRAGVRLHVDVLGAEELLGPFDGQPLDDIDELAAAVVALAGIALGVLVREHGPLGRHDGRARVVLAGDHLQADLLPRAVRPGWPARDRDLVVSKGPLRSLGGEHSFYRLRGNCRQQRETGMPTHLLSIRTAE